LTKLAARSFFQPGPAALLKQNQFGATLGCGSRSEIYDGKDKPSSSSITKGNGSGPGARGLRCSDTGELGGDFSAPGEALIYDPRRLIQPRASGSLLPVTGFRPPGSHPGA